MKKSSFHSLLFSLLVMCGLGLFAVDVSAGGLSKAPVFQVLGDPFGGGGIVGSMLEIISIIYPEMVSPAEGVLVPESSKPLGGVMGAGDEDVLVVPPSKQNDDEVDSEEELPDDAEGETEFCMSEETVRSHLEKGRQWRFGAYSLYIWRGDGNGSGEEGFALLHRGSLVAAQSGHFYVTSAEAQDSNFYTVPGPVPGTDIDGNGLPDLLVYEYSGGMHCCTSVLHIECGDKPLLRALFYTRDSRPVFEDLNGDGRDEVHFLDTSYAYWNECYAASPFPKVVFELRNGRYEMAEGIMRKLGPSTTQVSEEGKRLKEWLAQLHKVVDCMERGERLPEGGETWASQPLQMWRKGQVSIPSSVWKVMLELLYSGRSSEAVAFVDAVWPEGKAGKQDFIRDVADLVMSSWFGRRLPWIREFQDAVHRAAPRLPPLLEQHQQFKRAGAPFACLLSYSSS